MGEDRELIRDEDEAVRAAVRNEGDEVEGHALPAEQVRDAVHGGDEDDVEGHALISENLPDANLPDSTIRAE